MPQMADDLHDRDRRCESSLNVEHLPEAERVSSHFGRA